MDADNSLQLFAPLSGTLLPLERVPDRVFAQKIVGEGIAIDPTSSILLAPCAGKVIFLHPAHHSLSLRTPEGVELLLHIGLDTVTLKGEGFTPLVTLGQQVNLGTPLIQFDAERIAAGVRSLITVLVITNGEKVAHYESEQGTVEAGSTPLLKLILPESASSAQAAALSSVHSKPITIINALGLHARPAAQLARLSKRFMAQVQLEHNGKTLDAKSLTSILSANIQYQTQVSISAQGQDASHAVQAIGQAIQQGLGDPLYPPSCHSTVNEEPLLGAPASEENRLAGVSTLPQIAIGQAYQWLKPALEFPRIEYSKNTKLEQERLTQALCSVEQQLQQKVEQLKQEGHEESAAVFEAHQELLDDPSLLTLSRRLITQGTTAEYAWFDTTQSQLKKLKASENPLLIERASDLKGVSQQVLKKLQGIEEPTEPFPENTILITQQLTPSETAHLDPQRVVGIVSTQGSATSHSALLARSLGIPTLAAIPREALAINNGAPLILDGLAGALILKATAKKLTQYQRKSEQLQQRNQQALEDAAQPATSQDGFNIEVLANIGNITDTHRAMQLGAEGVGLLRSEFLYMDQYAEPDEEEQAQVYLEMAELLGVDKTLTIRTLDAGGEKKVHYLHLPNESNPALGERGIRVGLHHPAMLRRQVRAILRASRHAKVRLLFPMVATLAELKAIKRLVQEEASRLFVTDYLLGIMVEVPSVALLAYEFAQEIDFFSLGTNDLTQYTLAMDRGNPNLSWQVDALNPAVLKLIQLTVEGARPFGKRVAACGAAASDPLAIPLLLGLGVTELSCSVARLPQVKQQIRELSVSECQLLAQKALSLSDTDSVRQLLYQNLEHKSPQSVT